MISARALGALVVAGFAVAVCSAPMRAANSNKRQLTDQTSAASVMGAGNGIYTVYVDDTGLYTATTGPDHPAGEGLNVFYGDGDPGTTFNSYRSFTTNTNYVQGSSLASFATVTPIGTTGFRTTYVLPGSPTTADKLTIISDVNVNGTTLQDSSISVTTAIQNTDTTSVSVGIRYEWDYQIGDDDGPTFQALTPDGAILTNEMEFIPPGFVQYRIVDNDGNSNPPTFFVFGTATGPSFLSPRPTIPDRLAYVSWPNAVGTAFDYSIDTSRNVAEDPINDSAVLYYFGRNAQNAITIPAGQTATVTALAFLSSSPTPPTESGRAGAPALSTWGLVLLAGSMLLLGLNGARRRHAPRTHVAI